MRVAVVRYRVRVRRQFRLGQRVRLGPARLLRIGEVDVSRVDSDHYPSGPECGPSAVAKQRCRVG